MKIKLRKGRSATGEAAAALEAVLGCQLSDSFKTFLLAHDGAKPESNVFRISETNESGVSEFIPVAKIPQERRRIENLPRHAYPIAWAEGGNYVFIDEDENGAVFFWDHELPEQMTELAPDCGAFLELLEPFDISTVQLKPGQLEKVWVDPEFLKKLGFGLKGRSRH